VTDRLRFAETVEEESITNHQDAWDHAIRSIADESLCPAYNGLVTEEQIGLVPIGRDSRSGLWEFAHLQTGEIPERGSDGTLIITEETGLVFVLIPAGTFHMGAAKPNSEHPIGSPNADPQAQSDESPVHPVTLGAFFLSKYEMTQAQWRRFMGHNPSYFCQKVWSAGWTGDGSPPSFVHPVEQVSWYDCDLALGRLGLLLPTEAQWEYAARAGTTTVRWTGNEIASLQGAANLADGFAKSRGAPPDWKCEPSLEDGYMVHAPVGRFRPNAFGLHDMIGNVWEWCRDGHVLYDQPGAAGDGFRLLPGVQPSVYRGAAFDSGGEAARVARRHYVTPESRTFVIGLRPSRRLTTE